MTTPQLTPLLPFSNGHASSSTQGAVQLRHGIAEDLGFAVSVSGAVEAEGQEMLLTYELRGEVDQLIMPALSRTAARRDRLWEHTCLEAFLAPKGDDAYWEFNLSPSGDWAVYAFDGYRQGMRNEDGARLLVMERIPLAERGLRITARFVLPESVAGSTELNAGLTAVLESRNGTKSYRALCHAGEKPDFHLRQSFIAQVRLGS